MYAFHHDSECLFLGQRLKPWLRSMRSEFAFTVVLIMAIEAVLLAWPIVATVIWKGHSFLTWIHFLFALRLLLLLVALFEVEYPQRLWGTGDYSLGWNTIRLSGGFSAYGTLAWWARLAFLHGILVTALFVLVTLGTIPVFLSNHRSWPMLLWGLSLGFHLVVIAESLMAPFVVWRLGIYRPVSVAYRRAQQAGTEGRPRRLYEMHELRDKKRRLAAVRKLDV